MDLEMLIDSSEILKDPDFSGYINWKYQAGPMINQGLMVEMPSNIALIKYMGKTLNGLKNTPTNSSLSVTLPFLKTKLIIEPADHLSVDQIEGLTWFNSRGETYDQVVNDQVANESYSLFLSKKGEKRFLDFFLHLKNVLNLKKNYRLYSGNNFPSDCGIASSSSSFAALTLAAYALSLVENKSLPQPISSLADLASLSRQGSGSSCRSFFKVGSLWSAQGVLGFSFSEVFKNMSHEVWVVEDSIKSISSSQAHQNVVTSLLFESRHDRAEARLKQLIVADQKGDYKMAFELMWSEFWDMHALFETSYPSFGYISQGTMALLYLVRSFWNQYEVGPLVTMDAGPNVHLFWPNQQQVQKLLFATQAHALGYRVYNGGQL